MVWRFFTPTAVLLLLCCCVSEPQVVTKDKYLYVCASGDVVSDPGRCSEPEPEVVEVLRFVCSDGIVVDDSSKCKKQELGTTPSTPTTTTSTTLSDACTLLGCPPGTGFVGSKTSNKYHLCTCRYAVKIKPENLVCFSSKKEAEKAGYMPCGTCKP